MHSIQVVTFLSLNNILTLMFNSHNIPIKVISKQAAFIVSHPRLFQVISKQVAVFVYHSDQLLVPFSI